MRRWFIRVDLPACELLAAPGLVGSWASEYHEAAIRVGEKPSTFSTASPFGASGLFFCSPFLVPPARYFS
jgi:hypothetical protein